MQYPGVCVTTMPACVAASTSIASSPTPYWQITRQCSNRAITSASHAEVVDHQIRPPSALPRARRPRAASRSRRRSRRSRPERARSGSRLGKPRAGDHHAQAARRHRTPRSRSRDHGHAELAERSHAHRAAVRPASRRTSSRSRQVRRCRIDLGDHLAASSPSGSPTRHGQVRASGMLDVDERERGTRHGVRRRKTGSTNAAAGPSTRTSSSGRPCGRDERREPALHRREVLRVCAAARAARAHSAGRSHRRRPRTRARRRRGRCRP